MFNKYVIKYNNVNEFNKLLNLFYLNIKNNIFYDNNLIQILYIVRNNLDMMTKHQNFELCQHLAYEIYNSINISIKVLKNMFIIDNKQLLSKYIIEIINKYIDLYFNNNDIIKIIYLCNNCNNYKTDYFNELCIDCSI